MTVWKVGMLAVCVDASFWGRYQHNLVEGHVYRVLRVYGLQAHPLHGQTRGLDLGGAQTTSPMGFCAQRFRPAVQDDQACEEEFITLLKRSKPAKAPANSQSDTSAPPFQARVAGPDDHSHGDPTVWPNHQPRNNARDQLADLNSFVPHEKSA